MGSGKGPRSSLLLYFTLSISLILMAQAPLPAGAQEPRVIIDWAYARKERLDVGAPQTVGFHMFWEPGGAPVVGATVYVDGAPHVTDPQGIVLFSYTSDSPGRKEWSVDRIVHGGKEVAFEQLVEDPWCVFDVVHVDLYCRPRVDVGTTTDIEVWARYFYDDSPFEGEVILNNTRFSYSEVGRHAYAVVDIVDRNNSVTDFYGDPLVVVWDRVDITLFAEDGRVDVGSEAEFTWIARYESDKQEFGGSLVFNDSLRKDEVGRYTYTVERIEDPVYNISSFDCNSVPVVFDRVDLGIEANDTRINVGEEASISWSGTYAYDSKPFTGDVRLNTNRLSHEEALSRDLGVGDVDDPVYGIEAFSSNTVEVVWDRMGFELSADDERIDVGEEARIGWRGFYEYDGEPLEGVEGVLLNSTVTRLDDVGAVRYAVVDVVGEERLYGIDRFGSNVLTVVWDRVDVDIEFPHRFEVGTEAKPTITARYAYDGEPFEGEVRLSESLIKNSPGRYTYRVASIDDGRHGITGFESNEASCVFDRMIVERSIRATTPGRVEAVFRVYYESDDAPVMNARVVVNGMEAEYIGAGNYVVSLPSLLPRMEVRAEVSSPGFTSQAFSEGVNCIGNMGLYASIVAAIAASVFFLRKRRG